MRTSSGTTTRRSATDNGRRQYPEHIASVAAVWQGVLASYGGQRCKDLLLVRYMYRPVSFVLTVPALRMGISANEGTLINLLIVVAAFVGLASGIPVLMWVGAFLYVLVPLTDCVDGNIARFWKRKTYYGKLTDGLVDTLAFSVFIAIGVGNALSGNAILPPATEIALGFLVFVFIVVSSYFRARLMLLLRDCRADESRQGTAEAQERTVGLARRVSAFYENLGPAAPILLVLAMWVDAVTVLLAGYAVLFGVFTVAEIGYSLRRYGGILAKQR